MLRDGVDSERAEAGRIDDEDSAGRLAAGLLVVRRAAGRDLGAVLLGREVVEPVALGLAVLPAVDLAVVLDSVLEPAPDASGLAAALPALADDSVDLDLADVRRPDDALGPADDLVACRAPVRGLVVARDLVVPPVDRDRVVPAVAGLTDDIVLAAAVSALAAVDMALVAVFIDFMADDIVLADTVALVAAAVILLAAEFTLVAAEDTVRAAVAGDDAEVPRAAVVRVERAAVERDPVVRDAVERAATERDPADRGAVLRVDREAVLRVAVLAAVPLVDLAAALRVAVGLALDVLELDVVVGRLAAPLGALRLTDLLRAVLAELRRLAARVVD